MIEIDRADIQPGDTITRMFGGATIGMRLKVTKVHEDLIFCGPWTFDLLTGVEEDAELGWGRAYGVTGSYIAKVEREEE